MRAGDGRRPLGARAQGRQRSLCQLAATVQGSARPRRGAAQTRAAHMWWVVVVKRQARCADRTWTKNKVARAERGSQFQRGRRAPALGETQTRGQHAARSASVRRCCSAASPLPLAVGLLPSFSTQLRHSRCRPAAHSRCKFWRRRPAAKPAPPAGRPSRRHAASAPRPNFFARRASARANYAPGTPPHPSCLRRGSSIPLLQLLQQHAAESVSHAASPARLSQHAWPARSDREARRDEAQAHPRGAARRSKLGAPARRPDRMPRRQKGRGGVGVALPSVHVG